MSHLRVYTCTNVKRCPYFAELYRLSTEHSIPTPRTIGTVFEYAKEWCPIQRHRRAPFMSVSFFWTTKWGTPL